MSTSHVGQKRKRVTVKKTFYDYPKKKYKRSSSFNKLSYVTGKKPSIREIKCVDNPDVGRALISYAAPPVLGYDNATGFNCLNLQQENTGYYGRIGNKIVTKSVRIKFGLYADARTVGNVEECISVRCMLVYDKSPNGVAPVFSDILQNASATGVTSTYFTSSVNMNNKDRFVIIRDKSYNLSSQNPLINVKWYCKGMWETIFKGTSNPITIANIRTGAFYFLVFTDGVALLTPTIESFGCRMRYYD